MTINEQDSQQIARVLEQYRHGFATMNVEALKAIWDQDYDPIIYITPELSQPILGWAEVERYYQGVAAFFEGTTMMDMSTVSVDCFGDVALAFVNTHFEGEGQGQRHIANGHISFLLRRQRHTWKVIHYHESRRGGPLQSA